MRASLLIMDYFGEPCPLKFVISLTGGLPIAAGADSARCNSRTGEASGVVDDESVRATGDACAAPSRDEDALVGDASAARPRSAI